MSVCECLCMCVFLVHYVSMCMCVLCVNVHAFLSLCVSVFLCVSMLLCMHLCENMYACISLYVFLCVSMYTFLSCVCVRVRMGMSPAPQQGCCVSRSVSLFARGQEPLTPQPQEFPFAPLYLRTKWGLGVCPALVLKLAAAFCSPGL